MSDDIPSLAELLGQLDEEDEEDQHEEKHEVFLADPRPP